MATSIGNLPILKVVGISGSPSRLSHTRVLVDRALHLFRDAGCETFAIAVADLPSEALLHREQSTEVEDALEKLAGADIVVLASPVYKASFTGALKCFIDCLPRRGLAGKVVVPVMVGGTTNHMLVIEHALCPLIASEGGVTTARGVYAVKEQVQGQHVTDDLDARLTTAVSEAVALTAALRSITPPTHAGARS